MTKPVEQASKLGKEAVDNGIKSLAAVSKSAQAIAVETGEYVKKSYENGTAAVKDIAKAKSFEQAVEIQSRYAKSAYEGFVAQATRMGELYADMAKEAFKPFENAMSRVK